MKKTQILAMFVMMTLLSSFMSIGAQTRRVQGLVEPGKKIFSGDGKIQSFTDKTNPLASRFADRMKRNFSTESGQGFCEYTVTNTDDSGSGSLREAIDLATGQCDIIITATGTLELLTPLEITQKNLNILFATNSIFFVNTPEGYEAMTPDLFVVDASGIDALANERSAFIIRDSFVLMAGFTITGGSGSNFKSPLLGGGIYVTESAMYLLSMTISGNTATEGAGIFSDNAGVLLVNSTVSGNSAISDGYSGAVPKGGGIYLFALERDCDVDQCGELLVSNSTISGNTANIGGGVYVDGVAELASPFAALILNSTIAGNSATEEAGGLAIDYSYPDNDPSAPQGTQPLGLPTVALGSSIVAGNTVSGQIDEEGPDIAELNDAVLDEVNSILNLIGNYNGSSLDLLTNIIGTSGSPVDARLKALADNGGPTKTMELETDSQAIDAGIFLPIFTLGDQRFQERPVIYNTGSGSLDTTMGEGGGGSDGTDIGAYELQNDGEEPPACSDITTYSQGGWSATSRNAPMSNTFFNTNFGSELILGSFNNNRYVRLTSATAVTRFLPQGGNAATFKNNTTLTNPTNKQVKNVLAGQTLAAIFNYQLNSGLANAQLATGMGIPLEGTSVGDLITMGNNALGNVGGPYSKTYLANLARALEFVNLSFPGGTDQGFLTCSDNNIPDAN